MIRQMCRHQDQAAQRRDPHQPRCCRGWRRTGRASRAARVFQGECGGRNHRQAHAGDRHRQPTTMLSPARHERGHSDQQANAHHDFVKGFVRQETEPQHRKERNDKRHRRAVNRTSHGGDHPKPIRHRGWQGCCGTVAGATRDGGCQGRRIIQAKLFGWTLHFNRRQSRGRGLACAKDVQ